MQSEQLLKEDNEQRIEELASVVSRVKTISQDIEVGIREGDELIKDLVSHKNPLIFRIQKWEVFKVYLNRL